MMEKWRHQVISSKPHTWNNRLPDPPCEAELHGGTDRSLLPREASDHESDFSPRAAVSHRNKGRPDAQKG